ncbi:MAG: hypothetical protein ACFFCZ_19775 [Promethearchaeota archaeon]
MHDEKISNSKGMIVQQSQAEESKKTDSMVLIEPEKSFILIALGFFVLIILSTTLLRIPIVIPTHWVSVVFFLYVTPIFLYSLSTMVRSWIALAIVFPSLALGELLWCGLYGCAGELPLNVIITFSTWGIGCLLISLLRKKNELVAMLTGALWGFIGLLVPALIYYALILNWSPLYMVVYSLISTVFNLVFIPVSLLLNLLIRRMLKVQHLDELLSITVPILADS